MTATPASNTSTLCQDHDVQGHVGVARAKTDFSQVQRSLSTPEVTGKIPLRHPIDLEKGPDVDRQETFDLREYLTSSNDANSAAGIKHKHVGVTWEDLEVSGIGGEENKVRYFTRYPPHFQPHGFLFARSTCPHTQVSSFVFFFPTDFP
jgi:ATP-binding cassette subfamily G (WHITE) protein 2 (SNQ2)